MAPLRLRTLTAASLLKIIGMSVGIVVILSYGYFQARFLIEGPQITLESPTTITQNTQMIQVRGTAKNITTLTLNGKTIHTDEEHVFEEILVLPESYTIMTLRATDRYGRVQTRTQELTYSPHTTISLNE